MSNPFVRKLSELAQLSPIDIAALDHATARGHKYSLHQNLICEGDEPGPMFVVLEGWVCRYKILPAGTRQIVAFLLPGDACDLNINMLAKMDHGIQTLSPAVVATIKPGTMQQLMQDSPAIARAMYTAQLIDEGVLRAWIISIGRRAALERVAHLMCELYLRMRAVGLAADDVFLVPLSQNDLADALGLTPVHINRMLRQLSELGAMALSRRSLQILDTGKLAKIAGYDENYLHRRLPQARGLSA